MSPTSSRPHSTAEDKMEGERMPDDTTTSSAPCVPINDQPRLDLGNATSERLWHNSWQMSYLDGLSHDKRCVTGDMGVGRDVFGVFSRGMPSPADSRRTSTIAPDGRGSISEMELHVQRGANMNVGCEQTSRWRTMDHFIWVIRWALVVIVVLGVVGAVFWLSMRSTH